MKSQSILASLIICTFITLFPAGATARPFRPVTFDDGMGGPELPAAWTVIDWGLDGFTWSAVSDREGQGLGTGPFACVDSDAAGYVYMDEQLISPTIDASGADGLTLVFDHYFETWDALADVDVSIDDGEIWHTVASFDWIKGSWEDPDRQVIDISAFVSPTLKIRFHYYLGFYDYYWAIDNVKVLYGPTCPVVIDEVYYDPLSTDDGREYLILYNSRDYEISLDGWGIEWGGTDFYYGSLLLGAGVTIPASDILVIGEDQMRCPADIVVDFSPDLQNGGDASDGVRLVRPNGSPCDTVIYDSPNTNGLPCDGQAPCPDDWGAEDPGQGLGLQRNEYHSDTNNCADNFVPAAPLCPCAPVDAVIECGYEGDGSTIDQDDHLNDYGCTLDNLSGPDYVYQVTTTLDTDIVARINNMAADLDLFILSGSSGFACADQCIVHDDYSASILAPSLPGTYYIVVDGFEGAESDYRISVQCDCADVDQDGHADEACQGGDCDDTDPSINPGAAEDCQNGIDDDCDGLVDGDDPACGTGCLPEDVLIDCGAVVQGSTTGGIDFLDDYSCVGWDESGPEIVYVFSLQEEADIVATLSGMTADLDIFILSDSLDGACPENCITYDDIAKDWSLAPGDYYIVVDGHTGDYGDFTLTLECLFDCPDADGDSYMDEECGGLDCDDMNPEIEPPAAEDCQNGIDDDCDGLVDGDDPQCGTGCRPEEALIECGEIVSGTTVGGVNILDRYSCTSWSEYGPESVYLLSIPAEADITARINGMIEDLDIFILSGSIDGACPENCLDHDGSSAMEYDAPPGEYYIVVDGYDGVSDSFLLTIECTFDCPDQDGDSYGDDAFGCDDCDDSDPAVNPGADEVCDNGIDDDCNGLVDGDDPDCGSGCRPGDALIECGQSVSGTTVGGISFLDGYSCTSWIEDGPDFAYLLSLPLTSTITAMISGMREDLDIFLLSDSIDGACPENCLDNAGEIISLPDVAPGDYYIVVDGYGGDQDNFVLSLGCQTTCANTDGDAYYDEACGGGDCDDSDPDVNPGADEVCDDLVDNDCDDLVDTDDPDCGITKLVFIRHRTNDNQYLNVYQAPTAVDGEINPLLASDTWIGNIGTNNEITHMASGDTDGDGTDELIFIRHRTNDNQYLNIYGVPTTVDGEINPLLASDTWIGNIGTNNEITHMVAGDTDGDGSDELVFIRHRTNDNQYLNIYDIPTTIGDDVNPLLASDTWIGNIGTNNEITHMVAGDTDGDGTDELVFIRHRTNDNQYLNIYDAPTTIGGDINPLLASDTWIANFGTNNEITHMAAGDTDGDGTDELVFIRHRTNDNQYLNIYNAPTTLGGDINPLIASDLWIGNIGTSNEITHMDVGR